jgi:ubiquinone/menaquinone biosynthesis C-methylase UbiE
LGLLEFERTKAILQRFLPSQPAVVLDVGGGTGIYSRWLSQLGHDVHLIDQSSTLVEQARQATKNQPDAPISSFTVGDARSLDFPDGFADIVLLFGPLYHLIEQDERYEALREAQRVLKNGGFLFAAAISRFAPAVDGFLSDLVDDPIFRDIVEHDLIEGIHCNPTDNIMYFTDAYFHLPAELKTEIEAIGFKNVQVFPVEGIGVFVSKFDEVWKNENKKNYLLKIIKLTEREQEIIGVSPHLLGIGIKQQQQKMNPKTRMNRK